MEAVAYAAGTIVFLVVCCWLASVALYGRKR